jgi:hypothetical protein
MAKLLELPTDRGICAIPLKYAVYCRRCRTVSNSQPNQCHLCGSDRVVRLAPILDGSPDPPAQGAQQVRLALVRAVSA